MKKNMGIIDRTIRVIIVMIVAALILSGTLVGAWAVVLGVVAVVFLLTSMFSFCPLYTLFGFSTNAEKRNVHHIKP